MRKYIAALGLALCAFLPTAEADELLEGCETQFREGQWTPATAEELRKEKQQLTVSHFADVPRDHWCYDHIARLIKGGFLDPASPEFEGDRLLTRYEMAMLVAKLRSRGVPKEYLGKLEKEFRQELALLEGRVDELEKKIDNVTTNMHIRYSFKKMFPNDGFSEGRMRNLLWMHGRVNDEWTGSIRLENDERSHGKLHEIFSKSGAEQIMELNQVYATGKLGGTQVILGRQGITYIDSIDTHGDGIRWIYGTPKTVHIEGFLFQNCIEPGHMTMVSGDGSAEHPYAFDNTEFHARSFMMSVEKEFGRYTPMLRYWQTTGPYRRKIGELTLNTRLSKKWKLQTSYFYGDQKQGAEYSNVMKGNNHHGYTIQLSYGSMSRHKPNSWEVYAKWCDRPLATYYIPVVFTGWTSFPARNQDYVIDGKHYTNAWGTLSDGYRGWEVGFKYCPWKNVDSAIRYILIQDRDTKGVGSLVGRGNRQVHTLWMEIAYWI